mmetsp:Transcript_15941/g.37724  ORF Transcript_15941/g.37724 Transcript_15941/m.37724 type:complete len:655 (-) Transcript_15941:72-2036(-)
MGQASGKQDSSGWGIAQCGCIHNGQEATFLEADTLSDALRIPDAAEIEADAERFSQSRRTNAGLWASARRRVFSAHVKTNFTNHYNILHQVGEGTYGLVYEAETVKAIPKGGTASQSSRRVAVKCFKIAEANSRDPSGMSAKAMRDSWEKERAILSRSEHPHIVKMYESFEERQSLWVVLELCRGGELYEYIATAAQEKRADGGAFEEPEAKLYFRQMLYAVAFLHRAKIVHRDIKTENFLLLGDPGTPEGGVIKLCDFGTAVQLSPQMPRAMGRIGTLSYTAPEIYARRGADTCADVWSLGVVLYVLLVGASPFRITGTETRAETSQRILAGNYERLRPGWQKCSDKAKDFVEKLLVVEEARRLDVKKALQHIWLSPSNVATPAVLLPEQRHVSPVSEKEVSLQQLAPYAQHLLQLMTSFARLDPLQHLLLVVYAQVTPDVDLVATNMRLPWYDLFFVLDVDCDGRLGLEELADGLHKLMDLSGRASSFDVDFSEIASAVDMDENGFVDWVEWAALALVASPTLASESEPLRSVFRMLDRPSGDGTITVVDLLALLSDSKGYTHMPQEEARQMLTKWSSPDAPVPCLMLHDAQRALQAAAQECWVPADASTASPSNQSAKQPGWLGCCEQTHQDLRLETIPRVSAMQANEEPA